MLLSVCSGYGQQRAKRYSYIVHSIYPHARTSYTQGLEFVGDELYESTGMYGQSRLLRVDLESGAIEQTLATLPNSEFGEGITILGDTIFMLTWREGKLYLFDRKSAKEITTKRYGGQGWGLTSDGQRLYMSDGSSRITVRNRDSFAIESSHNVTLDGGSIDMLNELEWIEGRIWANIYQSDMIVIINPVSWEVEGVIDLEGLLPASERDRTTDVLNGIAYNRESRKIYVTGKYWSKLFEIEIIEE